MDPAVLTLIGTICGGVGMKVAEHFVTRKKSKFDDGSRIRDELRIEINSRGEEITRLEQERDRYRDSYYNLRDEFRDLQTNLTLALDKIKSEATTASKQASPPPPDPAEEK
jgi:uncharacterized coiled-coil DUF342 family protein